MLREPGARTLPWPVDIAVVGLAGAVQTVAYVHTAWWPLQLFALALLAWRVRAASPGRAAALGFVFGCAWLCAGVWWLYVSLHRYGGLPAWMAALAVFALASFLSLYLAAAMALAARCRPGNTLAYAAVFAAAFVLAELARGVIFTGFPWVAAGYAHVDSPLGGWAPWIGVYGIGALVAFVGGAIAGAIGGARLRSPRGWLASGLAAIVVVLGGAVAGSAAFTKPTSTLTVTLLQGNIPQNEKFEARFIDDALALLASQLERSKGQLVVGPETVIPRLPAQLDPAWWGTVLAHFRAGRQSALLGLPLGDETLGYTNSVAGISAANASAPDGFYRYDKHHLVPFGEFIPTGFRWFTELMHIPLGDFNRGPLVAPSFVVGVERVAPNICYEDLFGEELAARFSDPAAAPTILANVSNIGWFGETIAVPQHLQISRMRTLELQRPMLRATNTGTTAVIDHRGVVTAALPPFTRGTLDATVEGRSGVTPYTWWAARFGLWPLALAAFAVLVRAWARRPRP